nr:MAG TPA: hypothetical protein [Caudoviricetes sp.]
MRTQDTSDTTGSENSYTCVCAYTCACSLL